MNKKITALPALGATPATDDVLPIVDVSGTATTKKVTMFAKANKSLFKGQCPPQELQVDLHIILLFIVALNVVFLTFIYL